MKIRGETIYYVQGVHITITNVRWFSKVNKETKRQYYLSMTLIKKFSNKNAYTPKYYL